ncbi:serine/threonine protein kinase [Talaromyces proteolyticus]|uniref:Serine/threonine protein kinase n=1 Tax=Talaromyces proteolyticus TaxID=1131652 RepID=A0AAD4L4Z5_9EURO|nr:serine/threonine protein kinase [Talaromyces proteolyticus]KAH8703662.1 serine/threonine protein kinase [Talaromyces proteolyticus]
MSGRPGVAEKRFSANKFHPLPDDLNSNHGMANPNDATIDIPLTTVPSRGGTGARKINTNGYDAASNGNYDNGEKSGSDLPNRPGPGRRKKTSGEASASQINEEEDAINRMGRIYNAILNFSVITRYFIYVSPLALVIAIPIIIGATAAPNSKIGGVRIVWFFTWIEVVWLSLWVSKLCAHFLPYLFQFLIGIVSAGTKKYALILRALEIPLSLVGWSLVSLATFMPIMTSNPDNSAHGNDSSGWEYTVKQILFALLICTLILLAEKTLVQLISVSYHRKQYDTRIKESKHNIDLLGYLYEASRSMFPEFCKEFEEEDAVISDTILGMEKKKWKRHGHHDSVAPMRLIRNVGRNVGRVGDKVTAAFGNVASEITGKHIFDTGSAHSIVTNALDRHRSSEALAKRIWMSFVVEGKDALYAEDIAEVLGAGREHEAEECFHILDRDGNGDVSMDEMILTVAEFGRVRKSISRSMHDVDHAIHVLDNLLLVVALIIMILVFVSFVTTGAATVIAAGATSLLSLSFVFSVTAQEVLGSCVFLFVKHPFDVGDRVQISTQELFVEEISLLYTVFRTVAEQRITQVPNVVLNTTWIDNVTRSKAMRERISLFVDFATTFADIQLLKLEMEKFVREKENSRDFQPDIDIEVVDLGNMDKLELRVEIRHKSNWSNETVRAARRSKFMCALVLAIRKVPINGPGGGGAALGAPGNPSYSVAISDELAKKYREDAAAAQEDARWIPTSQMAELHSTLSPTMAAKSSAVETTGNDSIVQRAAAGKKMNEAAFVEVLNSRPAGYDIARPDESAQLFRVPSATSGQDINNQLSPVQESDRTSLLRGPSGRRRGGADTSPGPPSPLAIPPAVTGAAAPTDRYEIPSYYSAAVSTGGAAPSGGQYESNNPYGRVSPAHGQSANPYQSVPPQYQSPPARREVPTQGNAFAQMHQQQVVPQIQHPDVSPVDDEDETNTPRR